MDDFLVCDFEGIYLQYSSLAQSVEHSAVNRVVVGSSPTGGAQETRKSLILWVFLFHNK